MKTTGLDTDWGYEFTNDQFILYIQPASHRLNFREACEYRARELYNSLPNPVLSFSGGLDSELVLHCFYSQGLKIDTYFLHSPGLNDIELEQIKLLDKRYGCKTNIFSISPEDVKSEMMAAYHETGIPPNQHLYGMFYKMMPDELDIIQGPEGPVIYHYPVNNKKYYMESWNSMEYSRRRIVDSFNRRGRNCNFEKNSNLLLSTLSDKIYESFIDTFSYFYNPSTWPTTQLIQLWDIHVKPFIFHKYWKDELIYFPKFRGAGAEKLDWIKNGPKHDYRSNVVLCELDHLKKVLTDSTVPVTKYVQKSDKLRYQHPAGHPYPI